MFFFSKLLQKFFADFEIREKMPLMFSFRSELHYVLSKLFRKLQSCVMGVYSVC